MSRNVIDRETAVSIMQEHVTAEEKHWGVNSFYAQMARDYMNKRLEKYDAGEVIPISKQRYIQNGIEFEDVMMSDGSIQTWNYGYID